MNILSHFACQVNASSFNKCLDLSTGMQHKSSKNCFFIIYALLKKIVVFFCLFYFINVYMLLCVYNLSFYFSSFIFSI